MAASATGRLLAEPAARRLLRGCAALAAAATVLVVVQWAGVAAAVVAIAAGGAAPADVVVPLAVALAAWWCRAEVVARRDAWAARTSSTLRGDLRRRLVGGLLGLVPGVAARSRAGELVTTATQGVGMLDPLIARWVPASAAAGAGAPLVALVVLVIDPVSGAVLVLTGPLIVVLMWLIGTRTTDAAHARWETLGRLGALLVDTVRVLPTLVAYRRARAAAAWLGDVSEAYRVTTMRVLRTAFLSGFVLEFGATLSTALVAVTVGVRLFEGHLEFGRALLVLLLTPEFYAPLRALGAEHHARLEGAPAATRVYELLDTTARSSGTGAVPTGVPDVVLRGVVLRADGRTLLSGVDLHLPPGSRTALVGPSGAGKTSVARVLLGFAVPDAGEVLVDGVPLHLLQQDAWRSRIAYVPERPWLSAGSVADNVRLGRPDASDDDVAEALRRAGASELVSRLPQGVDTLLGEDAARLSGGERLRIALARAFVKDAAVVVLDEPTSQLDAATEAAVLTAVAEIARGRTLLTITHRPGPVALHDRVVRLAGGQVLADDAAADPAPAASPAGSGVPR
ncbi:thiol reductant ABC exporter subunit CydD [uncultured Cellulomonas sp.]|uniref:thiol reductant ABC exporter subunit CydD n=1 Tax=uncultured Cellulomonas sp. TaxID=189682 RepID=UPI00260F83F8|nr:thiol reductant ABC exporter subunit CydD [uncultured Cellulomonas sp.]